MKRIIAIICSVLLGVVIGLVIRVNVSPADKEYGINSILYSAETSSDLAPVLQNGRPTIVVFGADYCPTCVNYKPYIESLIKKVGNEITIKYIDTVDYPSIRKSYNIELIPSTLFYDSKGNAFRPSHDLEVVETEEIVDERRYISDDYEIISGEQLSLNPHFEYGQSKDGRIAYCKFVGLLDMIELEQIAEELILQQ